MVEKQNSTIGLIRARSAIITQADVRDIAFSPSGDISLYVIPKGYHPKSSTLDLDIGYYVRNSSNRIRVDKGRDCPYGIELKPMFEI